MNTKKKSTILFIMAFMFVFQFMHSQTGWTLEEETNLNGMVQGIIKHGHIFKTTSGSIYEITGFPMQIVLELSPEVIVLRNGSNFKLIIEGFNEHLECEQLKGQFSKSQYNTQNSSYVIESKIESDFNGWDGETIFKLTNGQIWQQSSYAYNYHYAYRPDVIIYKSGGRYKMKVEGINRTIYVERLK